MMLKPAKKQNLFMKEGWKYNANQFGKHHLIPIFILVGFALWFSYDIYSLNICFSHADIYTYYYPYRQWFSQQLINGEFPLWNPYWGIGQPVALWATIPLDFYTILELIFGPEYHYFQLVQLIVLLLTGFWAFVKIGFKPMVATAGILLFFMSPTVTFYYFYFVVINSYIAHILLFIFIFQWFNTKQLKYLFYVFWVTVFSLLGTKPEFWFYQTVFFTFFSMLAAILFIRPGKILYYFAVAVFAMFVGLLPHVWQINLITGIMSHADRSIEHGFSYLWSAELYGNLFLSISESSFLKILVVGLLFYWGMQTKKSISYLFLLLAYAISCLLNIWQLPVMVSFYESPVIIGAGIGLLSSLFLSGAKSQNWKNHLRTGLLFLLFVYYWCRTDSDLYEMTVIHSAPIAFTILFTAVVWLGCTKFQENKLVRLAYFSILFIFIMRDQGQIILSHLTGLLWIPRRENYIIDFAFVIIGMSGIASVRLPKIPVYGLRQTHNLNDPKNMLP